LRETWASAVPFLAVALAIVIVAERFDRFQHEIYYWFATILFGASYTNERASRARRSRVSCPTASVR
jgi:hypothetical protein